MPLNLQPIGLLDFLQIKNGGQYPQELSTFLQGIADLWPLYETNAEQVYGQPAAGVVPAGIAQFGPAGATTTPGTIWHFHQAGVHINGTAAGTTWYGSLGMYFPQPAPGIYVPLTDGQWCGNTLTPTQVTLTARDFWLPVGWSLALNTYGLGGAPQLQPSWRATRYDF